MTNVREATKEMPFVNGLGMKFVPVPIGGGPTAGQQVLLSIWDTRVQDFAAYANGNPGLISAWNSASKEGVPVSRAPADPVVNISWDEAVNFCQWLTAKEIAGGRLPQGMKYRLPTDEEWSWAADMPAETGRSPAEKSAKNPALYGWGKDFPPKSVVGNFADETYHEKFPPLEKRQGRRGERLDRRLQGRLRGDVTGR